MRPDAGEGEKRTNEIGTVIPLLETLPDIANRTVTADALLTQRALAKYLLGRGADYLFTVKGNQPTLHDDIRLLLDETIARRAPDFMNEGAKPEHGRRETALHLGLQWAQRLPQLPRRRTSLRDPPPNPGGQVRQAPLRDSLRCPPA